MESLESILLLMVCVMVSSIFDQVLPRVSIPLVQIALGAVVGFLVADVPTTIFSDPELFLLIFIAPLLFNESRHADKESLWKNKGSVISLAVGLVVVTTLVVGFVLNLIVPSLTLAAAFALGAALGPTDAVAVMALGKEVSLTKRQKAQLSGEALINDASGVVCFDFAIAAAVTGAFSLVDASISFLIDFFGGIALGLVVAAVVMFILRRVQALGLETPTAYMLLEVCTPFLTYLLAEQVGVSGVLAVVAAGLLMKFYPNRLTTDSSRYATASENVWELISYAINGIVFVLLGMKLPEVIMPTWNESGAGAGVWMLGLVLLVTVLVLGIRFLWVLGMDAFANRAKLEGMTREQKLAMARDSLVVTLSGPKGAVTLAIVLSIPYYLSSGIAFPERDLLIFLASGVIICTLLLANFVVPVLAAPSEEDDEEENKESFATVQLAILQNVISGLRARRTEENRVATTAVIESYRARMNNIRAREASDELILELRLQSLRDQREFVNDKLEKGEVGRVAGENYVAMINTRISSLERGRRVPGAQPPEKRPFTPGGVRYIWNRIRGKQMNEKQRRAMNALIKESEHHAIDYLDALKETLDEEGKHAAALLKSEHLSYLTMMDAAADGVAEAIEPDTNLPSQMIRKRSVSKVLRGANRAKSESLAVEAEALGIELEQIQLMREAGRLSSAEARELREEVYVMQMGLESR